MPRLSLSLSLYPCTNAVFECEKRMGARDEHFPTQTCLNNFDIQIRKRFDIHYSLPLRTNVRWTKLGTKTYIYIKILKQLPHRSPRENLTRGIQTPSVKVWAGSCAVWFLNEKWRVIGARISLVIDLEARRTVGILTRKSYGSGEKVSRSSPRIVFQIGQWHWSEYRVSALDIGSLAWDEQAKRDARPRSCTPPSLALSSPRFLPASAPMGGGRERILRRPLNRGETWIRWGGGGEEVGLRFRNVYVQLSWPQLRIVTRSSVWACSVSLSLSLCYDNE